MLRLLRVPSRKGDPGVSVDMSASFNDVAYGVEHLEGYSVCAQIAWASGTLAGTIKLQACNNAFIDREDNAANSDAVWTDVAGSSVAISIGSSTTTVLWNVSDCFYEAFRIVWTRTGGTGTLTYYVIAKGQA